MKAGAPPLVASVQCGIIGPCVGPGFPFPVVLPCLPVVRRPWVNVVVPVRLCPLYGPLLLSVCGGRLARRARTPAAPLAVVIPRSFVGAEPP